MSKVIGPVQYKGKTVGPVQFDPRDIGHLGPHQPQRNLGPFEDRAPSEVDARVKPGLPRLNTAHELATGLVGAWPMAQLSGTTVEDLVGEGDATVNGGAFNYERDQGPVWQNSASYLQTSAISALQTPAALSISMRFRCSANDSYGRLFWIGDGNDRIWWEFAGTTGYGYAVLNNGTSYLDTSDTTNLRDGEWHDLVVIWDGSTLKTFVDMVEIGSAATSGTISTTGVLTLGAVYDGSGDQSDLEVADARIWSRALSAAEIARMYADPWALYRVTKKPDYPVLDTSNPLSDSLVFDFPMSEGGGSTLTDLVGDYNATATGTPDWDTDNEVGPFLQQTSTPDYYKITHSLGDREELSVSFWYRHTAPGSKVSASGIVGSYDNCEFFVAYGSDNIRFNTKNTSYGRTHIDSSSTPVLDGDWHHICGTYSVAAGLMELFVDGISQGTESISLATQTGTEFGIGASVQGGSLRAADPNSQLARLQIFDRALPASDVADLAEDPWLLYLEGDAPTGTSVTVTPSTAELGVFASADASVSISNSISASVAGLVVSGYAASVISENYLGLLHLDPGPGFHEYRIFGISGSISGSYSDIVSVEFAAGTGSYSTIITGSTLNTVIQSNAPTVVGDAGISVTVDGIGISSNPPIVIGAASVFTTTESVAVSVGTVTVSAAAIVTVSTVNVGVGAGTASVVGAGNAVIQTTAANLAASANAPAVATGTAVAVTTVSLGLSINPTSTSGSGTITVTPTTASSVLSISDPAILSGTTVATTTNSLSVGANPAIVLGSGQIVAATSAGNLAVSVNPPTVATSVAVTATTSTASLAVGLSAPAVATQVFNTVSATTASIKLFVPDSTAAVGSTVSTTSIGTVLSVSDASVVIISEGTTVVDAGLLSLGINDPTVVTVRYITATTTTASMAVGAGTVLVEDSISATATPSTASVKLYTSAVEVVAPKQVSVSSANAALNTGTPTVSAIKNVTVAATTVGLSLGSNSVTTTGAQTVTVSATTSSLSIFARLASASAKVNVTPQPTTASLTTNVLDPIVDTSNVVIRVEASGLSLNISSIAIESVIADSAELTELESPSVDPTYKRDTGRSKTVHSDINLREDFNIISAGGSEWIGLRIANKNMKCSCGIGCSRCLGTGYQFTDYLTKARVTKYSPGFMLDSTIGQLSTSKIKVYLPSNRIVNKGDMILTLDINNNTSILNQPIRINRQYIVAGVSRHTDEKGRILYYQVIAEERNTTDYVRN